MRKSSKGISCLLGSCFLLAVGLLLPGSVFAESEGSPFAFTLFKSLISSTDGNRCSHVPSCACYAKEAVEKHGPIKGMLLSCDRLIRCGGDDTKRLPQVVVGGHRYAWDPVSDNDFWWEKEKEAETERNRFALPLHFKGWD